MEPLVPELLDVPVEPLVDGDVLVELPDEPMPEREPEVDEPLVDGIVDVELPEAPMPEVVPEVDDPLPMLVDDDGVAELLAEPPAEPMPEAEPETEPVGPELQAARAPAQASAIINFFM